VEVEEAPEGVVVAEAEAEIRIRTRAKVRARTKARTRTTRGQQIPHHQHQKLLKTQAHSRMVEKQQLLHRLIRLLLRQPPHHSVTGDKDEEVVRIQEEEEALHRRLAQAMETGHSGAI
jgi:hypothetical protein